ncbi:WD repeat-containing protein 23 [Pyricularia oryzae]|nr:WD repeat-containing protein 23 [Pyricularia oryzae]
MSHPSLGRGSNVADDDIDDDEQYHTAPGEVDDELDPDYDHDDDEPEEEDDNEDNEDNEEEEEEEEEEDDDDDSDGQEGNFFIDIGGRMLALTLPQLHALISREDPSIFGPPGRTRPRTPPDPDRFPKVPSEKGTELMDSGLFGVTPAAVPSSTKYSSPQAEVALRLLDRELGLRDPIDQRMDQRILAQTMIPSDPADMLIRFPQSVYSGQFSDDGNFFYAVGKDFKVRMYDTSNPYNWRYYKTARFPFGQWTLSDASLSPDNRWLAITSLLPHVCLAPTDPNDSGDPYTLDLSNTGLTGREQGAYWRDARHFAIFSVRYSGDSRELVAGTNRNSVIVYDIESRTVLHNVVGHNDDVNAVCFADKSSPHILYSGSDDTTIKVWDRRSMADRRAAGAFVGHIEGLTYIDSKNDGRYLLSNGKDHSMKLWDLRMAMSEPDFSSKDPTRCTRNRTTDYRWTELRDDDWFPHPHDNSVVTFRGHRVTRTLIRCHFSPPGSTNSRYVYSGSFDGKVYIWNLDATLAGTIDVGAESQRILGRANARPSPPYRHLRDHGYTAACIREAHWHPKAPMVVASAWGGDNTDSGFCSVHSFNDGLEDEGIEMGRLLNERLEPSQPAEYDTESEEEDDDDDDYEA